MPPSNDPRGPRSAPAGLRRRPSPPRLFARTLSGYTDPGGRVLGASDGPEANVASVSLESMASATDMRPISSGRSPLRFGPEGLARASGAHPLRMIVIWLALVTVMGVVSFFFLGDVLTQEFNFS